MSLESIQQNYSDATGFVIDRTVSPPKILGQAFLVSKSRAVTCASAVFNYEAAPWALGLNFIHPGLTDSVKSITLHQDFDKVAARKWYLAQSGNPGDQLVLPNDMASLSLDFNLPDLAPDKVAELQRALAIPFQSEGVEQSGAIQGIDFLSILTNILQTGKEGLVTLLDARNVPLSRIQIGGGAIQKCYFKGLLGEVAFFELLYRKPAQGYSFQAGVPFNWGNVRDITAPANALIEEAQRRVGELSSMINYLGGNEARYQKRTEKIDPSAVSENIQWLIERLWNSIDGYLTLDMMSERVGADTYTIMQAMRELVNRGMVSMINRSTPFHGSGEIGAPLVSHTDFEVNAWDPLQAFYLDPLSGKPTWMQGNFFGVANALQPKNMLHTIAMPNGVPGALILKDYKLIGVHSGPHTPKPGTPLPPVKLQQMMWMGALLEMSSKRPKMVEEGGAEQPSAMSSLRGKMDIEADEAAVAAAKEAEKEKFVCPNCYSTNSKVGPCFNCGTEIVPPEPEVVPEGAKNKAVAGIAKLQEKYKVSNAQLALVAAVVIGFPLVGMTFCSGGGTPPPTVTTTDTSNTTPHHTSDASIENATKYAGFKGTAIPTYWYEDTSELTKPAKSFGLYSDQNNQKVIFVIMDDEAPVKNLENFVGLPPYTSVERQDAKFAKVDENFQLLGDGNLHWFLGEYKDTELGTKMPILTAAYQSPEKGKSILVVGQALHKDKPYDYKSTLWLCDQMASDFTAHGNQSRAEQKKLIVPEKKGDGGETQETPEEKPIATDKEIDDWVGGLSETLESKLKTPDDIAELLQKKKPPKIKAALSVVLGDDGNVKKLEITDPGDYDSATSALTKAVNASAPFENMPHTKDSQLSIIVKLENTKEGLKIKVERP
ncbi:MAG TPA: hypothetical protein V6C76_07860 [Drouetiella sp.]